MTAKETADFEQWKRDHLKVCPIHLEAEKRREGMSFDDCLRDEMGGFGAVARFGVLFRPGTIGDGVEAVCDCGARHDITDPDNW